MGLKRRGTGRRPVLNLSDKQDTSRRTWQTKYQQICADHMIKNGVRAGSPMHAKDRSDAQQNCGLVTASDSTSGAVKNPLVGLLGQYNSDSDEDGEEAERNKKTSEKSGGGLDAKVEDFMREIQALVPEPVKQEEKNENPQQEVEVPESDAWQQCYDHSSGYVYFWNVLTNEVSWEPPPGYDTEMLQPYSGMDATQAVGGVPMAADYSHVTPEQSVVTQQMIPGVPMQHVMPGVSSASAAVAASAYAMKMPYGMPGVGHAHALVGMMHGYPAAPAMMHPHHQAYLQLKQKSTSKLKVPGLEDEEDDEDPYRPSVKAASASVSGMQSGGQQHSNTGSSSDTKASASNDADDSCDGKIEMITSFSQDSDDEEELSGSSVEKARPPPKRRKADAIIGVSQTLPINTHPSLNQQILPAVDVVVNKPASNEGPVSSASLPKGMHSVSSAVGSNFCSSGTGTLLKDTDSSADNGKVLFKSQAPLQPESSKDAPLFPSVDVGANERGSGEKQDVARSDGFVDTDKSATVKAPTGGRGERKPPPLSLIATYGAEDSDDEDGERHKELKSQGARVGDKSTKSLFPISVNEDEEMLDSRAFRRKRRIQVANTSKARAVGTSGIEKTHGGEGRQGTAVENMAKLAHLWSDRESREEGGERRGLGFGGNREKDHVAPTEEGQSSKGQKRKAGLIAFIKAETINLPPSSEQDDFEKKRDSSVEKLCQDLSDKVEFLREGSKDDISPVQEISIELQALRNAYVVGALSSNYFGTWLQERWATLERTEEGAAPPGWVVQWCRDSKRYCYIEEATGKVEWSYPIGDSVSIGQDEDHGSSKGHLPAWSKEKELLWESSGMGTVKKDNMKPLGMANEAAAILRQNPPLPPSPPSIHSPPPPPPPASPPPPPPPPPSPPPPPPPPPPPATPPPPPPPPSEPLELAQPLPPGVESPLVPFHAIPNPASAIPDSGEKGGTPPGDANSPSPPHWSPDSPKPADWGKKAKKNVQVSVTPVVPPAMVPPVPMDVVTVAPAVLIPEVATFPSTHHTIAKPPARADSLTAALDSFYSDIAMLNEPAVESASEADPHSAAPSNARAVSPTPVASSHPMETKLKETHGQDVPSAVIPASEPAKPKKKKQPKLAPALSLKKKSVSTLVAKWQQVQEDVRREEMKESSGERP